MDKQRILNHLLAKGLTLATVESLTGGLLANSFVMEPGASRFFMGGWIPYTEAMKKSLLGIPNAIIEQGGMVQETVARSMVSYGLKTSGATLCLATTGQAGPTADAWTRVGDVYLAIGNAINTHIRFFHFEGNRTQIRQQSVEQSWVLLNEFLETYY